MSTPKEQHSCLFCGHSSFSPTPLEDTEFNGKTFSYQKCNHCELVQLSPLPNKSDFDAMYPTSYQGDISGFNYDRINPFLPFITKDIKSVLDYGCGVGAIVKYLVDKGIKAEGTEYNPALIKKLNEEIVPDAFMTIEDFPNTSSSYDLIILDNVLEHLTNPIEIITLLKNRLNPGGRLLVRGPLEYNNSISFFLKISIFGIRKRLTNSKAAHAPFHITLANYKSLKLFFESNGFQTLSYKAEEFHWPFPSSWSSAKGISGKLKYLFASFSKIVSGIIPKWGNAFIYFAENKK